MRDQLGRELPGWRVVQIRARRAAESRRRTAERAEVLAAWDELQRARAARGPRGEAS